MGKPTGFIDYERVDSEAVKPKRVRAAWTAAYRSASRERC